MDWIVLTDHGNDAHSRLSTDQVLPFIEQARKEPGDQILIYHGLEWNIPGAGHATVFAAPGRDDIAVLKELEARWGARAAGCGAACSALHRRRWSPWPGATLDPAGPAIDGPGNADPWNDLWFYTNPIFVGINDQDIWQGA